VSAPRRKRPAVEKEPAPREPLWSKRARADLEAIGDYIAMDDPVAAERWVGKLMEKAKLAAQVPRLGRGVPELGREDLREVLLRSYRIVYRIRGDEVQVITVFEGHRLFPPDVDVDP
jgi:toxin ParE1/3/4